MNWVAYASPHDLSSAVRRVLAPHEGVLLFLAMGPRFGSLTSYTDETQANPFDRRAIHLVQTFLTNELAGYDPRARLVYPLQQQSIDLRACLDAARAQYVSRLGIGIRPDCGTWFAVRAAVATTLSAAHQSLLSEYYPPLADNGGPCVTCVATPCRTACPANAVTTTLSLTACLSKRLEPRSECEARCHARESCPVGREFMYPESQLAYHNGVSLNMIRRWSNQQ